MIPGIRGTLLSEEALEHVVPDALRGLLDESGRAAARRRLIAWHTPLRRELGPATGLRTIFDRLAVPLVSHLGYRALLDGALGTRTDALRAVLESNKRPVATLIVTAWGEDPSVAWRDAVHQGIAHGLRWCLCVTGPSLRSVDSLRTYSRQHVEIDLETAIDNERTFAVLWGLLRAEAMNPRDEDGRPLIERAIEMSERHRTAVRASLQLGVNEALTHLVKAFSSVTTRALGFNEALIVIYRILFLLFAEARGLVPGWHPIYRDGYTIEALRQPIETYPRPRGLWETLQAISRLAHRGCRIGSLRVTPFNGRLFSPTETPLAERVPLDDGAVRQALLALTTRTSRGGRQRIAYGDLGVEQLGGVYERVLDLDPAGTDRRKTTGSFYTPRPLTEFLVRRTLAPLVHDASPDRILSLRILDPAMGSGAFLVAACRYLAVAYENALIRDRGLGSDDVTDTDRADFRRTIAQRCLYGVDLNPMAVQLGRLSLWLATLSADRPLTFLDHRLRTGNSLVGTTPMDLAREPGRGARRQPAVLPLFDDPTTHDALRHSIATRQSIATEPGDTLAQVRAKEQALARLEHEAIDLSRWKQACDLWCSAWFRDRRDLPPFHALMDAIFGRGPLPGRVSTPILDEARATADRARFFHWPLEFPEVFYGGGDESERIGFDAILGNPPWEMLRGDLGVQASRDASRAAASRLTAFARGSGVYALQGNGHANLYQLFLERMLSLLRRGGRLGVILPAGLAIDQGAASLRRALLDRSVVDTLISFENRDGVFPIHRGLKFLLLSATTGSETTTLPCRFGVRRPETLDDLAELSPDRAAVSLHRRLIERLSGDDLAIPDVRSSTDVNLLAKIAFSTPALGDADGWNVQFGRELNATDDREHFHAATTDAKNPTDLPIVEGKHLTPFAVDVAASRLRIAARTAGRLLNPARTFLRTRLAYRDVASSTNRLTLIAALVPAGTITTHTLFCLKTALDDDCQRYLCAIFNSFVANYLVRLRVSTHVTTAIIDRLPVPKPAHDSAIFIELASLGASLITDPSNALLHARMQAVAARAYNLDRPHFRHILDTFPLVPRADRDAAMACFCDIVS
jgi:Eco57I restriction-modification methylase